MKQTLVHHWIIVVVVGAAIINLSPAADAITIHRQAIRNHAQSTAKEWQPADSGLAVVTLYSHGESES